MSKKIDVTKNLCRERQFDPKRCDPKSFRTKKPNKRTLLTFCCPKGKFVKGRCKVPIKLQSKSKRKVKGKCPI